MIGILGGGLTGLTLASQLRDQCEVLERAPMCGGLCQSIREDGFTFDTGGAHIIYSRDERPVEYMLTRLGYNYEQHRRNNKVYYQGRFIKYPFENGLSGLDIEDRVEALYHYMNNPHPAGISFKSWIYHTFGKWLAEEYLIPYNEKVWNYDLSDMSAFWVEGRVPKPPAKDVIRSALGEETEGYTHQLHFYYPKRGGIQALIQALESDAHSVFYNFDVKLIERSGNSWLVSDQKTTRKYEKIISTIPIFSLIGALPDVPRTVTGALNDLKFNSLITVMLGINAPDINEYTAIYFPDRDFLPNRVSFPTNFSSKNAPEGMSSAVAEITAMMKDKTWVMNDAELINHVIDGLHKREIINKDDVVYTNITRSKYAYVIYDRTYRSNIKTVRNYIKSLGIELCGRFSEFEYLNMDACVSRALHLAEAIG